MKLFFPAVVVVVCGLPAAAIPTCTPGTAATYAGYGANGCAEDPFTLKNFAWNSFGSVTVTASEVWLTPSTQAGVFGIGFTGVSGNPNPFNISGRETIFAGLDYLIDPRPPILNGVTVNLNGKSPVAPGFAKVTTLVCAGDTFLDSCAKGTDLEVVVEDFGEGNPNNILTANVPFPTAVSVVDIRMILDMEANGASSEITGAGTAVQTAIPEPAASGLVLGGIATFLVALRRRRQS